jgi:hypothetical protein
VSKFNKNRAAYYYWGHMRRKRKKSYIDVEPPVVDVDNLIKDTTRTERFQVFEVLASIRRYLIVLLMVSGALSTFFSVQFLMGIQLFSSPLALAILAAMSFIGIANVLCGLLLLGSE